MLWAWRSPPPNRAPVTVPWATSTFTVAGVKPAVRRATSRATRSE